MIESGKRSDIARYGQPAGERSRAAKYDPDMCDQVRIMAQSGAFPEEWCAFLGISFTTMYRWANEHPEFEDACIAGWHLCSAFWSRKTRDSVDKTPFKGINAGVLLEILRKRFPSIWGKDPSATYQDFEHRPRETEKESEKIIKTEDLKTANSDDLNAAIHTLEERRRHLRE